MTAVLFVSLIVLLFIGVPIAFVLCGSSILAILASGDINSAIVIQRMFSGCGSFTLLAIPFFVLAGNLMSSGGISRRLVNLCNSLFGHISGGLAMVAIITCAFFAAMVILAPLLAPVAQTLGIDLVHFGVVMMANLAIGMMTPPVGVNLYVVCDTAKVKIEGMMPYLLRYFAALVAGVLVITYVPQLSLLFVNLFGK